MPSTPLVTGKQAADLAHVPVGFVKREVPAVACAVRSRALLYPLAAVMRAERDSRVVHILDRLRHAGRCA